MAAASTSAQSAPPLGKYLASSDKKTRDKAIKSLSVFLSDPERDALPKTEMAKLWKGIFYCFWMSDKPLVQQALATEIAEIVLHVPSASSSLEFLRGFWEATVREWAGIDRLRIDKYYMLIRRFVNASFRRLIREGWDASLTSEYNAILTDQGGPLCPEDIKVPPSLPYHLADVYLEELDKAIAKTHAEAGVSMAPAPLGTLLAPFLTLAARTPTKTTLQRVQSSLLDPLFQALSVGDVDDEDDTARARKRARLEPELESVITHSRAVDSGEDALPRGALRKALLKQLFDVASEEQTRNSNRRKLYDFWKGQADEADGDGGV